MGCGTLELGKEVESYVPVTVCSTWIRTEVDLEDLFARVRYAEVAMP